MKNKKIIDFNFNTWWDMLSLNKALLIPSTNTTYEVINRNGDEMLRVNRGINGTFKDTFYTKNGVKRNFYALKTGYYPDGIKATDKNIKSISVFKSVYKHFNNFIYTNHVINLSVKRVYKIIFDKNLKISC
jgi:hypothetical protein